MSMYLRYLPRYIHAAGASRWSRRQVGKDRDLIALAICAAPRKFGIILWFIREEIAALFSGNWSVLPILSTSRKLEHVE